MKSTLFNLILKKVMFLPVFLCISTLAFGQNFDVNYDENKIPPYTLPEVLKMQDGTPVTTQKEWIEQRRPEIMYFFETEVFGKSPLKSPNIQFKVLSENKNALNGKATRKEVQICFSKSKDISMLMLIYLPNQVKDAVPVFIGLNFGGNQTINDDPGISISQGWIADQQRKGEDLNKTNRGSAASRWPVDLILEKGYGVATIYCGDIDPDYNNLQDGVISLFCRKGQTKPESDEWATIAAWSWGLSRALDYFEKDPQIDAKKVIVTGHSRLGKAALWAGAKDQRFAMVVSNDSGCGGAALSRRKVGETVEIINTKFPYWFCENFKKYNKNEDALPIDQHELIALVAPRPIYIASAEEDLWADPKGEFLSGLYASPVYTLFGLQGLPVNEMPKVNQPVMSGQIAYHIRTGKHDITRYDWEQYLIFADKSLKKKD